MTMAYCRVIWSLGLSFAYIIILGNVNTATAWSSSWLGRWVRKLIPFQAETSSSPMPIKLTTSTSTSSTAWYANGLSFGCTGCGKCCTMDGDVWLSPEEQPAIAEYLGETLDSFRQKYTCQRPMRNWVCLKYTTTTIITITTTTWLHFSIQHGSMSY
jgi:hypothetical protein